MVVNKRIGQFLSSDGITDISYVTWEDTEVEKRGIVQISHGMCEYIERYEDFAHFLCEKGFVVCGNDHLGHGNSPVAGKLGYFGESDTAENLVRDVYKMTCVIQEKYPDLPLFLLGHSMGSFIARAYIEKHPTLLKGAIISGTRGKDPMNGLSKAVTSLIGGIFGKDHPSKFLTKMAFGNYNKKYIKPETKNDWLTRDKAVVEKYLNDPFCNYTFSAGGFHTITELMGEVNRKEWFENYPKQLPTLIMSGTMDPVGNYGKGVEQVYEHLKKEDCLNVKLNLYTDGRHEMLNEINKDEVYQDILTFLHLNL